MALQAFVESLDGLDDSIKSLYQEDGEGKYRLDVEGFDDGSKVKEALNKERQASREAQRQLKELQGKYQNIDPEKYQELIERANGDEEKALLAGGKLDEVVNKRTERMKESMQRETTKEREMREAAEAQNQELKGFVLEGHLSKALSGMGLHEYAYEDALLQAMRDFELGPDNKPKAKEGRYGKDGNPLTFKEWSEEKKATRPHWFPATGNGGGAGHGGASGAKTMTQAAFDALPAKQRAAVMAAGTVISG